MRIRDPAIQQSMDHCHALKEEVHHEASKNLSSEG